MSTENLTADQIIELEQLALEETKLAEQADTIKNRRDAIKTLLRDTLGQGTHDLGTTRVQVKTPTRRLNTKRLAAAYGFDQHPEMYSATLDTTKVKNLLAPKALDDFYDTGAATVVVL